MARILIIDDDDAFREGLAETTRDLGHDVDEAGSLSEGLSKLGGGKQHDLIVLDQHLPDGEGLDFLRTLDNRQSPRPPVIILTAFATSVGTVEAMSLGAFDHLTKPVHRQEYIRVVDHALREAPLMEQRPSSQPEVTDGDIIGRAPALRETLKLVGLAAKSDATAILTGETGSGKELFARMLHKASNRRDKPFIAVNCAAIPPDLLESELFGHLKGAFSGAVADRPGHFKSAEGGTLFLDEIGEMPIAMQAKVLRVLEARTFTPVGSSKELKSDARIVAATHRDLRELVASGDFREDLYHRLNVLPVKIPSLRDRSEDIPLLAQHFLTLADGGSKSLSDEAVVALQNHRWPGNVRELRNVISRAVLTVRNSHIEVSDLLPLLATPADGSELPQFLAVLNLPDALSFVERQKIMHALKSSGGNRAEAARRLGIHRQLLYAKIRDYGLT